MGIGLLVIVQVAAGFVPPLVLPASRAPRALRTGCLVSMRVSPVPSLHDGLAELVDKYDAFLIDQWGVMHDGTKACSLSRFSQ